jgi:hypothetical protein
MSERVELAPGQKHDQGKIPYHLVQWPIVEGIATVLAFGAAKYAPNSWQRVTSARERYFAACIRHVLAWWGGERLDRESGLPHLHHAACNLMFLDHFDRAPSHVGAPSRPFTPPDTPRMFRDFWPEDNP